MRGKWGQVTGAHKATHVIGDIALQIGGPSSDKSQITVTIYLKDNRGSSRIRFVPKANEIDSMTREIAEKIWEQAQPFVLASYLYEHHDSDEALKLARRIIAEEPPENNWVAAAYSLIGTILSEQRNYDEAFKNLNKSIELNSQSPLKSPFPYIALGNALASQGNDSAHQCDKSAAEKKYDEAIEQYKKAIEIDPKSPVPYNTWGNTLRKQKNYEDAAAKYRQAIKLDPKFVWAYNNLGWLFYQQKTYPRAIEEYQRANDIDPRIANHKQWGRTLIDKEQYDEQWGKTLIDKEQYDEAIAHCQKAVDLDPKAVNGYNCWGDALVHEKKYDEAIEQYKKAIEIDPNKKDPNNSDAYKGWGHALAAERKYDEAIERYEKAIDLDPIDVDAYEGWGNVLREQGKQKAAEEKLAKASELDRCRAQ